MDGIFVCNKNQHYRQLPNLWLWYCDSSFNGNLFIVLQRFFTKAHLLHQTTTTSPAADLCNYVHKPVSFINCRRGKLKYKQRKMSRAAKIAAVARDIFGTLPNRNVRTGMQFLKKPLTGAYEARYYMESIEPYARKVRRFWCLFEEGIHLQSTIASIHKYDISLQHNVHWIDHVVVVVDIFFTLQL